MEEQRPGEADEARGDELEAERAEASAEGERAEMEREDELDAGREGGGGDSVLPAESDEERTGVMRPPGGA